jgi:hypothetical protein
MSTSYRLAVMISAVILPSLCVIVCGLQGLGFALNFDFAIGRQLDCRA